VSAENGAAWLCHRSRPLPTSQSLGKYPCVPLSSYRRGYGRVDVPHSTPTATTGTKTARESGHLNGTRRVSAEHSEGSVSGSVRNDVRAFPKTRPFGSKQRSCTHDFRHFSIDSVNRGHLTPDDKDIQFSSVFLRVRIAPSYHFELCTPELFAIILSYYLFASIRFISLHTAIWTSFNQNVSVGFYSFVAFLLLHARTFTRTKNSVVRFPHNIRKQRTCESPIFRKRLKTIPAAYPSPVPLTPATPEAIRGYVATSTHSSLADSYFFLFRPFFRVDGALGRIRIVSGRYFIRRRFPVSSIPSQQHSRGSLRFFFFSYRFYNLFFFCP